jgi:flagellar hook-basal body complex protein FliE
MSLIAPLSAASQASQALSDPNMIGASGDAADPNASDPNAINPNAAAPSFGQTLENAFDTANGLQNDADSQMQAFALGQTSDIHNVMIASEKATLALQLATQVRNKVIDAYQEVMKISM